MTTFSVSFEVSAPDGGRWETVRALVDTGSSLSVLPTDILVRLGIRPAGTIPCALAGGSTIESQFGEARSRILGSERPTLVLFGRPGEPNRLGAHDLEAHQLAVDTFNQRPIRVPALRMAR